MAGDMFGAIIQAIDHAAERTQKGLQSGLQVSGNQKGGANGSGGANLQGFTKPNQENKQESVVVEETPTTNTVVKEENNPIETKDNSVVSSAIDVDSSIGKEEKGSGSSILSGISGNIISDERLKELFKSDCDVVECFSKLNAYDFKYKPEALKLYGEEKSVDDGENIGVMAQELESNPITENVVSENEEGFKEIDAKKLTATNSAVLSDVCKRLLAIEQALGMTKGE